MERTVDVCDQWMLSLVEGRTNLLQLLEANGSIAKERAFRPHPGLRSYDT
jgi:hypothetical protein